MKKQILTRLIALVFFIGHSVTAYCDSSSIEKADTPASTSSQDASATTEIVEKSKVLWEQTKTTTGRVVDKSLEIGSSAADKSKELYSDGKVQGAQLMEQSKHAWEKSKAATGSAFDKSKKLGNQAMDTISEVSSDLAKKANKLYEDATQNKSQQQPAPVKEL